MRRRAFSAGLATLAGAGVLGLPPLAQAQKKPEEGREYKRLSRPAPTEAPAGKIEVVDFFWYSCPHCNRFEPLLARWIRSLPPDVVVRRVPVAFRDNFEPQQRLFYTLEAMGKLEELHGKVFETIHVHRRPTNKWEGIRAFAESQGLDLAQFEKEYTSVSIATKARRATELQDAYGVEGVPALGIAGRYYTDGTMAGNMERALEIADYLIAEARNGR